MSRARYVDPTVPRGYTYIQDKVDDLGLTDAISIILTVPFIGFTDSLGLTDLAFSASTDPGGLEIAGVTEDLAFTRILSFIDSMGVIETLINNDIPPTVGMSRPFTYDMGWRDIINKVESDIEQRYDYPEEEVWRDDTTQDILPGEPLVIHAKTNDPFYNAVIPVPGIRSYSGSDQIVIPDEYDFFVETGNVSVTLSRTSGQSVDITITALDDQMATITGMSLRAKPVKVTHNHHVKDQDIYSQTLNGIKSPTSQETLSSWANKNDTKAIMEVILNQRYKRLPTVLFSVKNANAIRIRAMLDLRLSDRITLQESETITDNSFYVETIAHSIDQGGTYHETVVGCEQLPVPIFGAAIFNDASVGFNIGVFGERSNRYNFDNNLFIVGQSTLNGDEVLGL